MADESWQYEEEAVHVFSLCIPTAPGKPGLNHSDWMHDEYGVRVKSDLIPQFANAIIRMSEYLNAYEGK